MIADCDPLVARRVSIAEATDTSFILSPSVAVCRKSSIAEPSNATHVPIQQFVCFAFEKPSYGKLWGGSPAGFLTFCIA